MNSSDNKKIESLAEWLKIAAKGVAAPGKERIRLEIGAHHAEAVAARLARGETEGFAQTCALAELGDPEAAALIFQKKHLTEQDEKFLTQIRQTAFNPLKNLSWATCLILFPLMWYIDSEGADYSTGKDLLFLWGFVTTCAMLPCYSYASIKRMPVFAFARWQVMVEIIQWAILGCFVTATTLSPGGPFGIWTLFSIYAVARRLKLWRKLNNNGKRPGSNPKVA